MVYLSGHIHPDLVEIEGFGYMLTPYIKNRVDLSAVPWGADTGCFQHPERFVLGGYLDWLSARPHETCLLATAPDVVGDAVATLGLSAPVLPQIRRIGYKAALVAQDGLEREAIPWDAFDVFFVGGTTRWKLSVAVQGLIQDAKQRGKWVHVGRVNSLRRMKLFHLDGVDSMDGTYLRFGPDVNLRPLTRWVQSVNAQGRLR